MRWCVNNAARSGSKAALVGGLFHFHVLNRADLDAGLPDATPLR
jgi:hypothetical protein